MDTRNAVRKGVLNVKHTFLHKSKKGKREGVKYKITTILANLSKRYLPLRLLAIRRSEEEIILWLLLR